MERFVIVRSNRLNAFGNAIDSKYIRVMNMFSDINMISILKKEASLFFHIKLSEKLFNQDLVNLTEKNILIFDGHVRTEFLEWIKANNPQSRIILWLWNTVEEIERNFSLDNVPKDIEIWSYSPYDCKNKNLLYNTTFFWDKKEKISDTITQDIYFVGKDKGRLNKILDFETLCKEKKISFTYHITKTHKYSLPKKIYKRNIPYSEVQMNIARTYAILDIQVSKTAGPSLRALEAMFYRKKLITDDKNVKLFRFYDSRNIFILGEDNIDSLREFLDSPFYDVDNENIDYYNIANWLGRFLR